jgi:hypothetical protein
MIITAPTMYDLGEIARLLEDTGILTAREAAKFDSADVPSRIVVRGKCEGRAMALLKRYLPKGNYGYTGYSVSSRGSTISMNFSEETWLP